MARNTKFDNIEILNLFAKLNNGGMMAIPRIQKEDILRAFDFIDQNGVPQNNGKVDYLLAADNGKYYPPKYVIAVADHLANKTELISTDAFNAVEAKNYLLNHDFHIVQASQAEFELTITADMVISTDARFTMNNLYLGFDYKPIDTYFVKAKTGTITRRNHNNREHGISNRTMPFLACQIYEEQLDKMLPTEKTQFPICQYLPDKEMYVGIYPSYQEFRKKYTTDRENLEYTYDGGNKQFVFYCNSIFTTITFVQECLRRFGEKGDKFVLKYKEKNKKRASSEEDVNIHEKLPQEFDDITEYVSRLLESKNIILRGAPGTGKSYLAKKIAAYIVSNGVTKKYTNLTSEQKQQVEFVQFHPSYDYTDFVEGLRPVPGGNGAVSFELKDGTFKKFVKGAIRNFENSRKNQATIKKETAVQQAINDFIDDIEYGVEKYQTVKRGNKFFIEDVDEKKIYITIPNNAISKELDLDLDRIRLMLESGRKFDQLSEVHDFLGYSNRTHRDSYYQVIFNEIQEKYLDKNQASQTTINQETLKKYVFIIDEINRGEISKIFGELFFAIDPGYRGEVGKVATQYANLHTNPDEKFYIPENVYIIGTMNDIDRSVDTFDFAMRRRFRFIEVKPEEHQQMLNDLGNENIKQQAIARMNSLNQKIRTTKDLNENYQIGAAYFLNLKNLNFDFDRLWVDYLEPLLREYVRGMFEEPNLMQEFAQAYNHPQKSEDVTDGDQG